MRRPCQATKCGQAQRMHGAPREQPSRQHRGDLHNLRIVCHPRQATKHEYITVGSSKGAAAMTSRWARRTCGAPMEQPPRQHRSDLCVVHRPTKQPSASTSWRARRTRGAPMEHHDNITATCASCVTPLSDRTQAYHGGHEERVAPRDLRIVRHPAERPLCYYYVV
jgi:hypothetical protein